MNRIFESFSKGLTWHEKRSRREAILRVINLHLGKPGTEEIHILADLRSRDEARIFRFRALSGATHFNPVLKGLLPIIDLDRDGATRMVNLDGTRRVDIIESTGEIIQWNPDDSDVDWKPDIEDYLL